MLSARPTSLSFSSTELSWLQSYKFFFGSWANIMLVLVPVILIHHGQQHLATRLTKNPHHPAELHRSPFQLGCGLAFLSQLCRNSSPRQGLSSSHPGLCTPADLLQLLGIATEELSPRLGQRLSGLLNATFGNAVVIIVGIVADEFRIVQTAVRFPLTKCIFNRLSPAS